MWERPHECIVEVRELSKFIYILPCIPSLTHTTVLENSTVLEKTIKIVGLFPIDFEDIRKQISAENQDEKVAMRKPVDEYLSKELGLRKDEIEEIGITELNRPKKIL